MKAPGLLKILILDELDYFFTKDQNLLYNLFDWPHQANARLAIIGIANTMDFPERLLPKIASRMGSRRLVFKPYMGKVLEKIVEQRVDDTQIFEKSAIAFLSRKIVNVSTDVRRALNLCRDAIDIWVEETNGSGKVGIEEITKTWEKFYSTPHHQYIKSLSKYEKMLLVCVVLESKFRNLPFVSLNNLSMRFTNMTNASGWLVMEEGDLMEMLYQLERARILQMKNYFVETLKKTEGYKHNFHLMNLKDVQINLNIALDDITFPLREDPVVSLHMHLF